jgi:hypothetical protein
MDNIMNPASSRISMDWWSVIAALAAVILIKIGVLSTIPW